MPWCNHVLNIIPSFGTQWTERFYSRLSMFFVQKLLYSIYTMKKESVYCSLTRTYRYRASPASISKIAWLASFMGLSCTHVWTFFSAASSNISLISAGPPINEPPILTLLAIKEKAGIVRPPSSGTPSWMNEPLVRSS